MIPVIDMHCDTISMLHNKREGNFRAPAAALPELSLRTSPGQINLVSMKNAGYLCQNFALFTYLGIFRSPDRPASFSYETPYEYACALSDTFDREMAANSDLIRPVLSASDIIKNQQEGYLSALKTIEEGAVYEGRTGRLKEFYDRGVRMTTLTWNYENELGFPNGKDPVTGRAVPDFEHGLKKAGKDMVCACEELGVIVDLSHLNDAGIRDVFDIVGNRYPIVASHSNCREVTGHPRNLTDENLRKLAECGGVTGVNFCDAFMNDRADGMTLISDMVRHIKHMKNIVGIDAIGLGSDFDGIENQVEFGGAGGIQRLAEVLEQEGFSASEIEKIFYRNVLRVYQEVLG